MPPVYKHVAPLGLKTSPLLPFSLSHFLPFSPPLPYPANPLILNLLIQTPPTLHSAGVLFLDQSPFYRHYAPLERKAILLPRFPVFLPSVLSPLALHIALRWSAVLGPIALL